MEINSKNRLVSGTYFMLWTVLLNTVFSDMTTVACPAPCTCRPAIDCTGTYVNCYNKGFKEVPTGIPKDTCSLNLGANQITTIDNNAFAELSQLTELVLYSNQITTIDNNAFAGLSQLNKLYLYSNQITTIDNNAFAGLSQLNRLWLQNNQITTIDNNAFWGLSQLNELYIYQNPLKCDCDLRQLAMFMQRKGILPYNETYRDEPKCSSPDHFRGMEIINVPYHNMSCDSTSETTLASTKTPFQEITRQRVLSTAKIRNAPVTTETTLASTKTPFQEISRQRVLSTAKIRNAPVTTEPAVYLPKTTDEALTRQILKSTPVIGDHHTTQPAVIPPKKMDDAPTQQLLKSTPVTGEEHIKAYHYCSTNIHFEHQNCLDHLLPHRRLFDKDKDNKFLQFSLSSHFMLA